MTPEDDFMCFNDLRFSGDDGLRSIAKVLREGNPSETFVALLANHIDPDVPNSVTGTKLVLKRPKSNRPAEKPNYELRNFVHRHVCIFNENRDAVFAAAKQRFGVERTAFFAALRAVKTIQSRNPSLFEQLVVSAHTLREAGDPEYQPVR